MNPSCWWVLGELLSLHVGGSLSFLLIEDAEDTSGNLVVDGLVVFVDNVDAECRYRMSMPNS
jgi:hypothetical protein